MPIMSREEFEQKYGPLQQGGAPTSQQMPQAQAVPMQQQVAPQPSSGSRIMSQDEFSALFGDSKPLPSYANGLTEKTPINISPVSLEDRARLSVGNTAGKIKFLNENYGPTRQLANGDLIVQDKNNGLWSRVDAKGLGDGDAWEMTKELVKDAADWSPAVVKAIAQTGVAVATAPIIAAAGAGSGGALLAPSLAAEASIQAATGAALAGAETSLGRLLGTYDADPEQQMRDIAIESLLNFGGTYVAAGLKPAISAVASGLKNGAKTIAASKPLQAFVSYTSGATDDEMRLLMQNPEAIAQRIAVAGKGGVSGDMALDALKQDSIKLVKQTAAMAPEILDNVGESAKRDILSNLPENFSANGKDIYAAGADILAKANFGNIDEKGFLKLFTKEEAAQLAERGIVSPMAFSGGSVDLVKDVVKDMHYLNNFSNMQGKAGASVLLDLKSKLFSSLRELQQTAAAAGSTNTAAVFAQVHSALDGAIQQSFDLKKPIISSITGGLENNLYRVFNESYSTASKQLSPFSTALKAASASGSDVPFENLLATIAAKGGAKVAKKGQIDLGLQLIEKHGGIGGKDAIRNLDGVFENAVAAKFMPYVSKGTSNRFFGAASGGAFGAGGLPAAGAVAGIHALSSPRLQLQAIKAAQSARQFMGQLAPKQMKLLANTPEAASQLVNSIIQTPLMQQGLKQTLIEQGRQAIGR